MTTTIRDSLIATGQSGPVDYIIDPGVEVPERPETLAGHAFLGWPDLERGPGR